MRRAVLLIFLFLFVCSQQARSAILLDKVMAVVNKDVITWSEVYRNMEFDATDAVKAMKEQEKRQFFRENEAKFLELMIDIRLQVQEAAKSGTSAGEEDVNRAMEGIKKKYAVADQQFQEMIQKEGFTLAEYKTKLAEQITISRIVEHEVRSKILVTEKDVDVYIAARGDLVSEGEGFSISHIFIKKGDDKRQAEEKARGIYGRLKAGEDFGLLAKSYSEDATSKSGGDCGFVKKSEISPEFLSTLSRMQPGEISEPFWTGTGVSILRLDEVHTTKSAQELREKVRRKILEERFAAEYKSWLKGLRERAYIDIKI